MPVEEQTRAPATAEAAIFRPCANCNAGLIFGQEWCLECGERQPSHETRMRGRRTAALITGGVLALAIIGFTLTWVALKDDARGASRDLLASAPGAAGDVAAAGQAPATGQPVPGSTPTTPGTGLTPSTTTPLDPTTLPKVTTPSFIPITPTSSGGASTTITPTGTTTTGGSTTTTTTSGTTTTTKKKKVTAVVLPKVPKAPKYQGGFSPTNAFDQDPYGADGAENPKLVRNAIDRDPATAWATQDYPQGLGKPGVGIDFDVGSAMNLNRMKITTDTPGFNVRIYGASDFPSRAAKVPGPGWTLLSADTLSAASTSVGLFTQSAKYQYYLVWIMSLPAKSQHVDINEVSFHAPGG